MRSPGKALFDEREILAPAGGMRSIYSRRLTIRDETNAAQYLLAVVDDVTERKAAEAKIAQLAHFDPLTNLPNRTLFRAQLEKELSFVKRGAQLAVLYLDLDHFKNINDSRGHATGDQVLQIVAKRLRAAVSAQDLVARLSGDEFVIVGSLMPDLATIERFAARVQTAVGLDVTIDDKPLQVTASIGVAIYPQDGVDPEDLLKRADMALYEAKLAGRNRAG